MRTLQITLFVIANVIFITQTGRHVHQLFFGVHHSVLDEFSPETEMARAEKDIAALFGEYRTVHAETRALEKGRKQSEVFDLRQSHSELYAKKDALASEISERERRNREFRDLWIFAGVGSILICVGAALYRSGRSWPGFSLLVTGFVILEYWSSPTFFGGAVTEFRALLLSKIFLTVLSLTLLYAFWRLKEPNKALEPTTTAVTPRATP